MESIRVKLVQHTLSNMAKGRMPQVMGQGNGFGQVFVQPKGSGDGAGHLGDFQSVGQPGAVVIPNGGEKNLGLMLQAAERLAVNNAIAISLEGGSQWARGFWMLTPLASPAAHGKGMEMPFFQGLLTLSNAANPL
jgi:hypothetical protein